MAAFVEWFLARWTSITTNRSGIFGFGINAQLFCHLWLTVCMAAGLSGRLLFVPCAQSLNDSETMWLGGVLQNLLCLHPFLNLLFSFLAGVVMMPLTTSTCRRKRWVQQVHRRLSHEQKHKWTCVSCTGNRQRHSGKKADLLPFSWKAAP